SAACPEFLKADAAVNVMNLVEVDVIGLQPSERISGMFAYLVRRNAALLVGRRIVGHIAVDFGGDHDLIAPSGLLLEPAPDDFLGCAAVGASAVNVGGIEEVDAHLQRFVHNAEGFVFGRERAKVHRPQTNLADGQLRWPKFSVIHRELLWLCRGGDVECIYYSAAT